MQNIKSDTVLRTIILLLALLNQVLLAFGKSPLPIENEEVNQIISWLFTSVAAISAWWKNNSFTSNAIAADEVLTALNNPENDDFG